MACAGRAAEKSVEFNYGAAAVYVHLVHVDLLCVVLKLSLLILYYKFNHHITFTCEEFEVTDADSHC